MGEEVGEEEGEKVAGRGWRRGREEGCGQVQQGVGIAEEIGMGLGEWVEEVVWSVSNGRNTLYS